MDKQKLTPRKAEKLEREHNVYIDIKTQSFNVNDSLYGWQPIPEQWLED
jgi:hypothetical protein